MTKAIIFVLCFLASGKAMADDWSTQSKVLAAASTSIFVMDWAQTRYITRHQEFTEQWNPILPEHPTANQVNANFAIGIALNLLIGDMVGEKWRPAWFGATASMELITVGHNADLGIRMRF